MTSAGASFGALDPAVSTVDNQPPGNAVARAEEELAQAEDTAERLSRKREKAEAALRDARQSLADAQSVVKERRQQLAAARKGTG